jgi:RNA polymerase sigma factor (TIGR02999 family)
MMRRLLIDRARARMRLKRAHELAPIAITAVLAGPDAPILEVLDLDRTLELLALEYPRPDRVVELRFFAGLELEVIAEEIAEVLAVSDRTVKRDWAFARAWLLDRLQGPPP